MDTIDVGGHWWLPERPEHRVPGWLSYTLSDGLQLRLIGRLRDYHDDHVGEYPRVLGDTERHQFTLEQCHRARYSNVLGDRGTETIRIGQAFRGCWYEPGEDVGGDSITMLLRHLVHWIRPKSINVSQTSGTMLTVSVAQLPAIELHSPHGVITLAHVFRTDGDGQSGLGIEQDVWLTHNAGEVRHASKLLETTEVVRDLISLAADRTATIEGVSIYHPDVGADGHRERIDVFASWTDDRDRVDSKVLSGWDCLFFFDDVGEVGMQALLDVGFKWRAELRRVMATMGSRGGYNSDRVLNRCAALESLDRRLHGRKRRSFRTRMSALADIAGAPFTEVVGDIDAWTKQLRDCRDHVAHHLVLEDPHGGLIDRMLSESAYLLFVLRLLREADMPNAVFDLVLKSKRVRQLRDLPNAIALHANR